MTVASQMDVLHIPHHRPYQVNVHRTNNNEHRSGGGEDRGQLPSCNTLRDLSVEQFQNQSSRPPSSWGKFGEQFSAVDFDKLPSGKSRSPVGLARHRRPPIQQETFEPLEVVKEGTSKTSALYPAPPISSWRAQDRAPSPHQHLKHMVHQRQHPLETADLSPSVRDQVTRHLAGQFQWLVTFAVPPTQHDRKLPPGADGVPMPCFRRTVYGCNLLSRKQRSASAQSENNSTDTYTLIATPLQENDPHLAELEGFEGLYSRTAMAAMEAPPNYDASASLKAPENMEVIEQAVSPALSTMSERGSSFVDGCSRGSSFSIPRIEDSLAELDRLDDDIELFGAMASGDRGTTVRGEHPQQTAASPSPVKRQPAAKRVSIAAPSATLRARPAEKVEPALRRSASLNLRNRNSDARMPAVEQKADVSLSGVRFTSPRPMAVTAPVKSAKPPTVPKFELPGEAVARRLKEQREARQAQQAEAAQRASTLPSRMRSSKPLTRPTFELPGEAISRRKREERDARLRAQEEEERKKREFKARPIKPLATPSALPRDTITSRARQSKPALETSAERPIASSGSKRLSASVGRAGLTAPSFGTSTQARGRNSLTLTGHDASRATSTSTSSVSGKRSSVSAEEAAQMRRRGREIFARDSILSQDKERERRDRETAAKLARQEAAERSRIASREWAEKKRRKELAMRAATND